MINDTHNDNDDDYKTELSLVSLVSLRNTGTYFHIYLCPPVNCVYGLPSIKIYMELRRIYI